MLRSGILLAVILVVSACDSWAGESAPTLTFERDIRPILRAHCFDCHGATAELQGNLDLRLVRFAVRGGDTGAALEPGNPDASLLIQRIRAGEMPPGNTKLNPQERETLERWIAAGAPTARPEPEQIPPGLGITLEERSFWAFQPLRLRDVPPSADPRLRTPIDAWLHQAMPAGLTFAPDADKLTLLRRASFDLLGLPPTPEQIERFLIDESADAYDRLLDELLQSPQYGERWARHWLDVAGYADSEGATIADQPRPWAYKYRDYVIRAFNADLPWDRFLHEQLAGDELAGAKQGEWTPEQIALLTATGYLRMAADGTGSGGDSPESRNQTIADTIRIVSTSLLGLSVGCAQCHDHRYDPIPQVDYYALRAVFAPALDSQQWQNPQQRLVSLYTEADRQKSAELEQQAQAIAAEKSTKQTEYINVEFEKELLKHEESLREPLKAAFTTPEGERTAEQQELLKKHPSANITPGVLYQYNQAAADDLKKFDERIAEVRAQKPVEQFVRALVEPAGHLPATHRFHRGDYRQPLEAIEPGTLQVLCAEDSPALFPGDDGDLPTSGRRLAFARWLTSRANPLTARVLVNRVWLHHFGRGIVETPADFGALGSRPTHPELLDWLADRFISDGWSLKRLHKTIMLSTAYRQSSRATEAALAGDPDNQYYTRKGLIRLDAETIRDRMLAAAGQLDLTPFGPAIPVKEDDTGQVIVEGQKRRSVYIQARRSQPVAMLQAFDAPVMEINCERRPASTVATQSLMLLNGDFTLTQATRLAERAEREAGGELPAQVQWAWQLALCRPANEADLRTLEQFIASQQELYAGGTAAPPPDIPVTRQILTNICQVLLTSNEFLYVD